MPHDFHHHKFDDSFEGHELPDESKEHGIRDVGHQDENKFQKSFKSDYTLGTTELYTLIGAVLIVTLILACMIYWFFCKKRSISMESNRRAKIRPISRRLVRKNTKTKALDVVETQEFNMNEQHGGYAEIQMDPMVTNNAKPSEPSAPKYEDLRNELVYAQIDIR